VSIPERCPKCGSKNRKWLGSFFHRCECGYIYVTMPDRITFPQINAPMPDLREVFAT